MRESIYRNNHEEKQVRSMIKTALNEDVGSGDKTCRILLDNDHVSRGQIVSRQDGILCGMQLAWMIYEEVSKNILFEPSVEDGQEIKKGQTLCTLSGPTKALLIAERTVLNFMSRLTGIATTTRKFSELAKPVPVLDTRKTTPGIRLLEKYAVRIGGGQNHRLGLYDMILIKENHITAAGGVQRALKELEKQAPQEKYEIEVESLRELKMVIPFMPDRIMLDNFPLKDAAAGISMIRNELHGTKIEISGGINIRNIRKYADLKPDFISIGSLTTQSPAVDMSFKIDSLI